MCYEYDDYYDDSVLCSMMTYDVSVLCEYDDYYDVSVLCEYDDYYDVSVLCSMMTIMM